MGQYVGDVVSNIVSGEKGSDIFKVRSSGADYIAAGISGALSATGIGKGAAIAANIAISTVTYVVDRGIHGEKVTEEGVFWAVGMGVVSGVVGGSGVDAGNKGAVLNVSKDVITNTASSVKRAMYQAKINSIHSELAVGISRAFVSVAIPNIVNTVKEA